jgi:hypothetical protein
MNFAGNGFSRVLDSIKHGILSVIDKLALKAVSFSINHAIHIHVTVISAGGWANPVGNRWVKAQWPGFRAHLAIENFLFCQHQFKRQD